MHQEDIAVLQARVRHLEEASHSSSAMSDEGSSFALVVPGSVEQVQ